MFYALTKEPTIEKNTVLDNVKFSIYNKIGENSVLENVEIQAYSYCEPNCIFQNTIIGKYCDIARNVRIGATQHPIERATSHHFTYRRKMYGFAKEDDNFFLDKRKSKVTHIGHDVWIGHGVVIEAGVHVGNGAVIGSSAVVTKDVPPYAIVVGVPAKIIRYRFDEDVIQAMQKIAWWDWKDSVVRLRFNDFLLDGKAFVNKYGGLSNE